jgi:hypothetical protein
MTTITSIRQFFFGGGVETKLNCYLWKVEVYIALLTVFQVIPNQTEQKGRLFNNPQSLSLFYDSTTPYCGLAYLVTGDRLGAGLEYLGHGQEAQILQVLVAVLYQDPSHEDGLIDWLMNWKVQVRSESGVNRSRSSKWQNCWKYGHPPYETIQ